MKKSSHELGIFDLHEVALIVGIEDHTVKNWTFGKPFSIEPSIRSGSRTFYDDGDVLMIALANQLKELGLNFDEIKKVLPLFRRTLEKESKKPGQGPHNLTWLLINIKKGEVAIELRFSGVDSINLYNYYRSDGLFIVNMASLIAFIKNRKMHLISLKEEKQKGKKG